MEEEEYDEPQLPRDAQIASNIFRRENVDGLLNRDIGTFYALNALRKVFPIIPRTCTVADLLFMVNSVDTEGDFIEETFITFFLECANMVREQFGLDAEEEDEEEFSPDEQFIRDRLSDLQPVDDSHLCFNFASFLVQAADISRVDTLSNFTSLVNISLKSNFIRDLTPLTKLPVLRNLDLTENHVTTLADLEFPALEKLVVANNRVVCIDGLSAPKLRTLNLSGNKIFFIGPCALQNTPNLEDLNLAQNNIKTFREMCFAGLTKLKKLSLAENGITCCIKAFTDHQAQLQELDLSDTPLNSMSSLEYLTGLNVLDIRRTEIEMPDEFLMISGCPIKKLYVEGAPVAEVEDARLEILIYFPQLEEIDEEPITFDERRESQILNDERLAATQKTFAPFDSDGFGDSDYGNEVTPVYEEAQDE